MTVKSTTQMTKAELLDVINDKNRIIAELNDKIDELSGMAVSGGVFITKKQCHHCSPVLQ